ncbi:helix-turn-helix domain-containing protein [uncultured Oxalicibacterium sp.]|uniref:GlxA family transcriptional regulator n=1 Tax=uncultured Oxalicibacterium sp. TaxID=1168540 RepID=UPI0025D0BDA0|nr:helix-turn-helix domain-containing protein [uncultured Oxalicibacterium sp.]
MEQLSRGMPVATGSQATIKHIGILVFDGVILADVIGAADVFTVANKLLSSVFAGEAGYAVSLLSLYGGVVRSSASVEIMTLPLIDHRQQDFDTLMIASGTGNFEAYRDPMLLAWLQQNRVIPRMAGIATGVFVMAAAGLLDYMRVTTHWALQDKLEREFPLLQLDRDSAFCEDKRIYTVNDVGIAAELALNFLEADIGPSVAKKVAESLSICPRQYEKDIPVRPAKNRDTSRNNKIQQASRWLFEHMTEPISVANVAQAVSMSERNFQRLFKRETGWTPHGFLLHLRLEAVRQQLTETDLPVDKIARRCGLLNGEHVSKLFRKYLSISPCEYRKNERQLQKQASIDAMPSTSLFNGTGSQVMTHDLPL